MANYSLILDTKFKPFTYDELIKTPLMETQAHQAIEEAYGELAQKASVWEEMANEQSDPYAYSLYKTYADDLNNKADQLLRQGLDISSRKEMLDMKSRYSKEIIPIENAYKRREELSAEQRKAMAANPTMLYERYANQMSLDDFIRNPSLDYGAQYSGALLTQQVATAASNLAKEVNTPEGRRKIRKMLTEDGRWLPYQYEVELQKGFTREDVDKAIRGDADANPILTSIVDGVLQASGVNSWGDTHTKELARYYANQGLYNAIGTKEYSNVTDSYNKELGIKGEQGKDGNRNPFRDPGRGRFPITSIDIGLGTSKKGEKNDELRKMFGTKDLGPAAMIKAFSRWDDPLDPTNALNAYIGNYVGNYIKSNVNPYTYEHIISNRVPNPSVPNSLPMVENEAIKASFYDIDGKLYSKEDFTKNNPNIPKGDYDKYISKLAEYLGVSKNELPQTYEGIEQAISNVEAGKGSGLIKGILLPISKEDTQAAIDRVIMLTDDGEDKLRVQKVTGYEEDGSYKLGDRIEEGDLLDDAGKLKGKGFFYVSNIGGKNNLHFKMGGEEYNIPISSLGSIVEDSNIDVDTMLKVQNAIEEIANNTGIPDWYNIALSTMTPENLADPKFGYLYKLAKEYEGTLNNAGAAEISKIVTGLLHNLKAEDYKVSSQTGAYNPYTIDLDE